MKTYPLRDRDTLVFSVDGGAWETVTFRAGAFKDVGQATAEEVAAVLNRSATLAAGAAGDGCLSLATASEGGHAGLEIEIGKSTAAAALGLSRERCAAAGRGPVAARLIGRHCEPFELPEGAAMTVAVDGRRRRIRFLGGNLSAAEAAAAIDDKHAGVARATRDGRVMLTSRRLGPGSRLEVKPPRRGPDAAAILGFAGSRAASRPHRASPARLACAGARPALRVINLSNGPLELPLATGTAQVPVRGAVALDRFRGESELLRRLLERRLVGLAPLATD